MRNRFLVQVLHHYHHGDTAFLSSHGDWASVSECHLITLMCKSYVMGSGSYAFRLVCKTATQLLISINLFLTKYRWLICTKLRQYKQPRQ